MGPAQGLGPCMTGPDGNPHLFDLEIDKQLHLLRPVVPSVVLLVGSWSVYVRQQITREHTVHLLGSPYGELILAPQKIYFIDLRQIEAN
jgi:hypothetical protein